MSKCAYDGCNKAVISKGWCNSHYQKWYRYGTAEGKPKNTGWMHSQGYKSVVFEGKETLLHIVIASRAIGKELPIGAEVHHFDLDRANNSPTNLVICPSRAYHMLLHRRQRAMESCGNPNWLKCGYCKQYDGPKNLVIYGAGQSPRHKSCQISYNQRLRNNIKE